MSTPLTHSTPDRKSTRLNSSHAEIYTLSLHDALPIWIAYVNLYIAILSQLDRKQAEQVGDLHVYATDSLDPQNGRYLKQILPLIPDQNQKTFIEERIRISAQVKQSKTFTVVIGNP